MKNHPLQIGTDNEQHPVFLFSDSYCHSMVTGNRAEDRQSVLRSLAQISAKCGIPVLATDTSGKFSGLSASLPCTLWDLNGETGLPLRTTVTEFGPLLLSELLGLNETQSDLLRILIKIADDNGLLLIDTKDLKALANEVSENGEAYKKEYGTLNKQTISAILRAVVSLETKGAQNYLFEPAIDVQDFLLRAQDGSTRIHILDTGEQESEPVLYASFLLFLLGELCENLPDPGEDAAPALLLLIDEAQLFLQELSGSLLSKTRKLLEGLAEKGVLVCLSAPDSYALPESLSSSLEQTIQAIGEAQILFTPGTGENAQTVLLSEIPGSTKSLSAKERASLCAADPLHEKYKIPFDRDSAYEFLKRRGLETAATDPAAGDAASENSGDSSTGSGQQIPVNSAEPQTPANPSEIQTQAGSSESQNDAAEATDSEKQENLEKLARRAKSSAKSLTSTTAGTIGRQVGKSIGSTFGSFGETLGGNIGASLGRGIVNTLFKS